MKEVVTKVEQILKSAYSTENYVTFVKEIFNGVEITAPGKSNATAVKFSNFNNHIEDYFNVGKYTDDEGNKIAIFAVQLKNNAYAANSRSTQRSFARRLIEAGNCDAAITAFYTPRDSKWRLSFVRLEYEMKFDSGRLKTKENLTPAKRYSFLVGKDEPYHTAIERFRFLILDKNSNPTLATLEEAFSVERVTNEFFALYSEKYHQVREWLESNEDFITEARIHNFTSAQFAKKLMGQIVFLYFLQKKGWLGVNVWPDTLSKNQYNNVYFFKCNNYEKEIIKKWLPMLYIQEGENEYRKNPSVLRQIPGDEATIIAHKMPRSKHWGDGPHKFMRILFEDAEKFKSNFYNDYLEPLFYEALNVNRGEQAYCPKLFSRIPFLSGGLFEPIDGYDWEHTDFAIPNEIFSNLSQKGKHNADGIFDMFDRYNFTMSEDEPLEREVAIDPEMLGKVFENLLEVNDRKSKGAFYTPREIVHYMCQESLINYLANVLKVDEGAIRDFILFGDFMKDEDTVKEKREGNGGLYIHESLFKIEPDGKVSNNKLKEMDEALVNVRIADPAVGSGAFPLGMLNEIVRARQNITEYLIVEKKSQADPKQGAFISKDLHYSRSPYNLKYETIRDCIFAADIEPSAVDITQLRLWLSLVIDDEIDPNGNEGIFSGHRDPSPLPNLECNVVCGNSLVDRFEGTRLINESDLIGTTRGETQIDITQGRFDTYIVKLIEKQGELYRCKTTVDKRQLLEEIEKIKDTIILSQLEGSLPEKISRYHESKSFISKPYILWQLDFSRVFREKGGFDIVIGNPPYIQLQSNKGAVGRIFEKCGYRTFFKMGDIYCLFFELGYNLLREKGTLSFINPNTWLQSISFTPFRRFITSNFAWPQTLITPKVFVSATVDTHCLLLSKTDEKMACKIYRMDKSGQIHFMHTIAKEQISYKEDSINIEANPVVSLLVGKILKGATTVGKAMNVYNGVKPFAKGRGIPPQTAEIVETHPYVVEGTQPDSRWLPLMRGSLMHRYINYWDNNYWILYGKNLAEPRDPMIFQASDKIIVRQTGDSIIATIIGANIICRNNLHICILKSNDYDLRFILAILNSKITDFIYSYLNPEKGEALAEVKKAHVEILPVPYANDYQQHEISLLVDKIMLRKKNGQDTSDLEHDVDILIYALYGLSNYEIGYVEGALS